MRTFRCDSTTWRRFKLICTQEDVSMQDKLNSIVSNYVNKSMNTNKIFNGIKAEFDEKIKSN